MSDGYGIETELIHADRDAAGYGDVTPPIYQTSTFSFDDAQSMARAAHAPGFERFYTRHGNPNHGQVERVLAAIEGGEAAMVSASGMGAISATAVALTKAGDHVVAQRVTYAGTRSLLTSVLSRFGVDVTFVDQADTAAFKMAMRPNTTLVMLESPSNPLLGITDIEAVASIAHDAGALVTVDNTIATPVNQRPIGLGADVVLHSATKYLGGHSDLIAGVAVSSKALIARIWETHHILGATLGPFDAWLLLRGLRTLEMRVARHNDNALRLAQFLENHPRVARVYYPGLASHGQHELAARQMNGFGGLLSFEVDGTFDDARRVIDKLSLVHSAVSLGGVESLIAQPAAMWPNIPDSPESRLMGIIPSLLRLSVGVERIEDLIADFDRAL
ncbi:MAG: aminotransferase class I/II-fold pyridoxal phosphate-dependent enzyme [Candidatus Eremiobacteraeota bacterium]|nr:aminotransferase class I/II-fold pyridoxal phosphate-dependent enzyme [Candidatus Eremiobacteraeota bacterium]